MIKIFILSGLIDFIVLILMNVTSGNPFQTFLYLILQIGGYVISLFDELMISLERKFFLAVIAIIKGFNRWKTKSMKIRRKKRNVLRI
jgi:DMSO/TMAO reductase YedYZ heme-binding membrane subunit